ncbi:MAG: hypothetical protein KDA89_20835 [Planctomycetaceae bacterium]|nr:hypothetical protein [Planctomycetaceae bacterium]
MLLAGRIGILRIVLTVVFSASVISGCGKSGPQGGPRVTTVPVIGVVHVDGQPAANLRVTVHITGGTGAVPQNPGGFTKEDGTFALSTYESGDGVPPGTYSCTFVWGEINLMNGQYSGDKLKGKYAKPETSTVTVTVSESDDTVDLGTITLTSG